MEPEIILIALLEALHEGADGLFEEFTGQLRDRRWIAPLISAWKTDEATLRFSSEAMVRWFDEVAVPTMRASAAG